MARPQFENLRASSLWCNQCKAPMPVRERLLLVLADKVPSRGTQSAEKPLLFLP